MEKDTYSVGFNDGVKHVIKWLNNKVKWLKKHNRAFYDPAYFLETLLEEYECEQLEKGTE